MQSQIKLILVAILVAVGVWLYEPPMATACVNWCQPAICIDYSESTGACTDWVHVCCDGGGPLSAASCPAGTYAHGNSNGGTCSPTSSGNGYCCPIGGSCECGEFYACPTPNNPGKQCACCPVEAACWDGKKDCPAGTVIDLNQVESYQCAKQDGLNMCGGIGSAQRSFNDDATGADCCGGKWVATDDCWTKPSGKVECHSFWHCSNPRVINYVCVSTCNATAPTNVSVTQGPSPTVANISWTSGTNGVSHKIYVGTSQTKVNSNCPLNDCHVNGTTLSPFYAGSNYSYPVTGLTPGTPYYFRVVTYKEVIYRST